MLSVGDAEMPTAPLVSFREVKAAYQKFLEGSIGHGTA